MKIISDYGHHPTEIAATLRGASLEYKDKRILAIIEPHMEERLATFFTGYLSALTENCEGVLICPIYRARQQGKPQHTSQELFSALSAKRKNVEQLNNYQELPEIINRLSVQYDVAIAFTAGELDQHLRRLVVNQR